MTDQPGDRTSDAPPSAVSLPNPIPEAFQPHSDGVPEPMGAAKPTAPIDNVRPFSMRQLRTAVAHVSAQAQVRQREMRNAKVVGPGMIEVDIAGCPRCNGKDFRLHRSGLIRCSSCELSLPDCRWVPPKGQR
jgi:hypothetical protein